MNKGLIVGFSIYSGLVAGFYMGFTKLEADFTKVSGIQAVAVEKRKGRNNELAVDKGSYLLRKLMPGDGSAGGALDQSLDMLTFDARARTGAGPHAKFLDKLNTATSARAGASDEPTVAPKAPSRPEDLKLARVSLVLGSGAVVNGRYRDIGEVFVVGTTEARLVAAEPGSGKIEIADAGGTKLWISTRGLIE